MANVGPVWEPYPYGPASGADDEIRTRDPHLGKVMLYQLSHVRVLPSQSSNGSAVPNMSGFTFVRAPYRTTPASESNTTKAPSS